jgi:hypothetical protein
MIREQGLVLRASQHPSGKIVSAYEMKTCKIRAAEGRSSAQVSRNQYRGLVVERTFGVTD